MKNLMKLHKVFLLTVFAFLLVTCSSTIAEQSSAAITEQEEKNMDGKEVFTELEKRMQKRISVDFRDTPIDDVIRIIADQADIDIIKSPNVTGNVTAMLTDVPLVEALSNVLAAHNYDYVMTKNIIRVAPASELVQVAEKLETKIYQITYADVAEVEKALKKFISKQGDISSSPGTSHIIVTDVESKIKSITTFISEIDQITPQVLVEAKIYDLTTTDSLDLGIDWTVGRNTTFVTDSTTGVVTSIGPSDPFITGVFDPKIGLASKGDGLLSFGILNESLAIDALITANQDEICAKLLANPRILVLDNTAAVIQITSELPFQELTQTSGGGNIGTTKFKEVGIKLMVTPHVARDGMIRLKLKPQFSTQVGYVPLISGGVDLSQPIVDTREAETTALIKDGQTVVIGGLLKKDVTQETSKIPFLGDVPGLGLLFRFEGEKTINSELVVFITPKIVIEPVLTEMEAMRLEESTFGVCTPDCPPTRVDRCNK
ncbi:MAG: secretin N-terminal domain-containing protein [Planctomycetota bacterium]|jgi:type IV pilus assembly protein PilQ